MAIEAQTHVLGGETPPPETAPVAWPNRIGRYALVRRLASGGMASVYLGASRGPAGFEKSVAVKVIHPHLAAEPQFVRMFLDEAKIAARLHHPNVVETLDLGVDDGLYYLVMEFVEGATLSAFLQSEGGCPVDPMVALRITADILAGLSAFHELVEDPHEGQAGLVHRDISPQNLMISMDGWAKLADFGIVRAAGAVRSTRTGELRGKLAYMSPEQAQGLPVDQRSDLFSLGVVLWELLTGQRLFAGASDAETLKNVLACRVPSLVGFRSVDTQAHGTKTPVLASLSPELRRGLCELVDTCLQSDPGRRFPNAAAMRESVHRLLRANPKPSDPRLELAALMQQRFAERQAYVRAALRENTGLRAAELDEQADAKTDLATPASLATPSAADSSASRSGVRSSKSSMSLAAGSALWKIPGVEQAPAASLSHTRWSTETNSSISRTSLWLSSLALFALGAATAVLLLTPRQSEPVAAGEQLAAKTESSAVPETNSPPDADISVAAVATIPETVKAKFTEPAAMPDTEPRPVAGPIEPATPTVRWEVSGRPRGATVRVNGERIEGTTPLRLELPMSAQPVEIRLEKVGMKPVMYRLRPSSDMVVSYDMLSDGPDVLEPPIGVLTEKN